MVQHARKIQHRDIVPESWPRWVSVSRREFGRHLKTYVSEAIVPHFKYT